jgi:predicted O-methyltransferase YrrM
MTLRRTIRDSRFGPAAALGVRAQRVTKHELAALRKSARWVVRSHEHTNWTYDLTPLNMSYLGWFVAEVTDRPITEIREYLEELAFDAALGQHITASSHGRMADTPPRYGRRFGWYSIVRATKPRRIVETGTDKGLGSLVLGSALLRNGSGRILTVDNDETSGFLIGGRWATSIDRVIGDSHGVLRGLTDPVDLFIHDSVHTETFERCEYDLVLPHLSQDALVLSDNAHTCPALMRWAEDNGRTFRFFAESPLEHWYPGGGIGVALPSRRRDG